MNTKRAKAMGQCAAVALAAALSGFASDAEADGELALRVDGSRVRLSYSLPLQPGTQLGLERVRVRLGGLSLYDSQPPGMQRPALSEWSITGDYRFGPTLGWRATGGVLRGESLERSTIAPGAPWNQEAASVSLLDSRSVAVPYLGLGYSSRPQGGAWAWHADLGVVMLKPRSAIRLGANGTSPLSYDTAAREGDLRLPAGLGDWRVSPVMQLGVSYSF